MLAQLICCCRVDVVVDVAVLLCLTPIHTFSEIQCHSLWMVSVVKVDSRRECVCVCLERGGRLLNGWWPVASVQCVHLINTSLSPNSCHQCVTNEVKYGSKQTVGQSDRRCKRRNWKSLFRLHEFRFVAWKSDWMIFFRFSRSTSHAIAWQIVVNRNLCVEMSEITIFASGFPLSAIRFRER